LAFALATAAAILFFLSSSAVVFVSAVCSLFSFLALALATAAAIFAFLSSVAVLLVVFSLSVLVISDSSFVAVLTVVSVFVAAC